MTSLFGGGAPVEPIEPPDALSDIPESDDDSTNAQPPVPISSAQPDTNSPPGSLIDVDDDEADDERDEVEDYDEDEMLSSMDPRKLNRWLRDTREERQLVSSLDQLQADDLSLHLYATHRLKRRLRRSMSLDQNLVLKGREAWVADDEVDNFVPPNVWTAWPLELEVVPRSHERFGRPQEDEDDAWTMRRDEPRMPGHELRDVLTATIMKTARKRFHQKSQAVTDERAPKASLSPGNHGQHGDSEDVSSTLQSSNEGNTDATNASQDNSIEQYTCILPQPAPSRPMPLADDNKAERILQPLVNSILAKFDQLLMGLQQSVNQSYDYSSDDSRSQTQTEAEPTDDEGKQSELQKSAKRKRGRPRKYPKPNPGESYQQMRRRILKERREQEAGQDEDEEPEKKPTSRGSGMQSERIPKHLRDWSDVLGFAALQGWSPKVIEEASRRCSTLFGEQMLFRTMPEEPASSAIPEPSKYSERDEKNEDDGVEDAISSGNVLGEASAGPTLESEDALDIWDGVSLYCPIRSCPRHMEPFSRKSVLRKHCLQSHGRDISTGVKSSIPSLDRPENMHGGVHVDGFLQTVPPLKVTKHKGRQQKARHAQTRATGQL